MKYEGRVTRRRKGVIERLSLSMKRVRRCGFRWMNDTFTHFLNTLRGRTTTPTTTLDYISKLPDCMLSQVISMLSIKDELKTRVLSKRWSNLFSPRTHLNFDVSNILGTDHELQQAGYLYIDNTKSIYIDPTLCLHEFIYRVDQFLTNFQGTHIHSFLLNFPLSSNSKQSTLIDHWISFAIARGVERIDLLFCGEPYKYNYPLGLRYHFPFALFSNSNASSTIKHMHLQYCRFRPNYDFIPFTNLRSLRLDRVKVDEILKTGLLSTCLLLEELSFIRCEFKFKSSLWKIVSSSLCHLQLWGFFQSNNGEVIQISLDCVKLTSLEYQDNLEALSINTPALKFIHHIRGPRSCTNDNIDHALSLFATLPQLEVLHLDIYYWVATSLEITQPLKHLKEFKLNLHLAPEECGLLWILTILQACPLLQKLSIMLSSPELLENEEDMKDDFETFSLDELKVIEMGGCVGNWYEMEFATNILKCTHKLERIVMSPYWRWEASCDWEYNPVWYQNGRERILEKLKKDEHHLYLYDCNSNPVWYQNGCERILEKLEGRAQLILV